MSLSTLIICTKVFTTKTLRKYTAFYNEVDVWQLADVFENFRDICLENYKLDRAWYYTSPGLAWDAMLKRTGATLELLTDVDVLLMFKNGIRGGVAMTSNCLTLGQANNKYMGEDYDSSKPSKYIQYFDANNLCGWAMSKPLPTREFMWMNEKELEDWRNFSCMLEVDLEYHKSLHDLHNDYPLAPERVTVNKVEKLIPNLRNKTKYVVHYENLKLYERLGLKITKIHQGINFDESAWLKKYSIIPSQLTWSSVNFDESAWLKKYSIIPSQLTWSSVLRCRWTNDLEFAVG